MSTNNINFMNSSSMQSNDHDVRSVEEEEFQSSPYTNTRNFENKTIAVMTPSDCLTTQWPTINQQIRREMALTHQHIKNSSKEISQQVQILQKNINEVHHLLTANISKLMRQSMDNSITPERFSEVKNTIKIAKTCIQLIFDNTMKYLELVDKGNQQVFREAQSNVDLIFYRANAEINLFKQQLALMQQYENDQIENNLKVCSMRLKEEAQKFGQCFELAKFKAEEKQKESQRELTMHQQKHREVKELRELDIQEREMPNKHKEQMLRLKNEHDQEILRSRNDHTEEMERLRNDHRERMHYK